VSTPLREVAAERGYDHQNQKQNKQEVERPPIMYPENWTES
jgi:hypothetical protein